MGMANLKVKLLDFEMEFATSPTPELGLLLIERYQVENRHIEALVVARRCTQKWPNLPEVHLALCLLHYKKGNRRKVIEVLDKVPQTCPVSEELGQLALELGHPLALRMKPVPSFPILEPAKPASSSPIEKGPLPPRAQPKTVNTASSAPKMKPSRVRQTPISILRFEEEPVTNQRSKNKVKRSLLLLAGLSVLMSVYMVWTWQHGKYRTIANDFVSQARREMASDTEQGYQNALDHFQKALEAVADDPPALVGAAYASSVLGGEFRRDDNLLRKGLELSQRAQKKGIVDDRLTAAHGLALGYLGKVQDGLELIERKGSNSDKVSAVLMDARARLNLLAGHVDKVLQFAEAARQTRNVRLIQVVALAKLLTVKPNDAVALIKLAMGESRSNPRILALLSLANLQQTLSKAFRVKP